MGATVRFWNDSRSLTLTAILWNPVWYFTWTFVISKSFNLHMFGVGVQAGLGIFGMYLAGFLPTFVAFARAFQLRRLRAGVQSS